MQRRPGRSRQRWLVVLTLALVGGLAVATAVGPAATADGSAASADGAVELTGDAHAVSGIGGSSPPTVAGAGASDRPTTRATFANPTSATARSGASTSLSNASAAQSIDPIVERVEYDLLPGQPDTVEARITYEIPDGIRSLNFTIGGGRYGLVSAEGFERTGEDTYEWDRSGDGGTVTIRHDVSESFRAEGPDQRYVGGTTEWAIVARPQTTTRWEYVGDDPGLEYRLTTAGRGYAGTRFAFLGPHENRARIVDGEQLTLVVPDAADPASAPAEILDSLAYASDQLRFDNRNEEVVTIVAPAGELDWGPSGLAVGADVRVTADARVNDPVNVWVHEYVHTRQYRDAETRDGDAVADDARWLIEGSAEYYAALLSHREGRIDFETFRDVLERGTTGPDADAVLADRSTWRTTDAEYTKGALVAGAIDRELRAATNGTETFRAIVDDWNDAETFSGDDLVAAAGEHGGEAVAAFVRTHTRTDATPSPWNRTGHARRFDGRTARFDYRVVSDPSLSVTGPYREGALAEPLVVGETVSTRMAVENVGDVAGEYRATLAVAGRERAVRTGDLAPGETTTVDLTHRLSTTGTHRIVVGGVARTVRIREPASPAIASPQPRPSSPRTGEDVDVTVAVGNPASRPANGTVTIRANGEAIATERVRLAPGENATVAVTTRFEEPGTYQVTAGGRSVQLAVEEADFLERVPPLALAGAGGLAILVAGAGLLRRRG